MKNSPVGRITLLLIYAMLSLTPILWMVLTAVKLPADTVAFPPRFVPAGSAPEGSFLYRFSWTNFERLFADTETMHYLWNSILVASFSTLASVAFGTLAGYAFSRFPFRGSQNWLFFILSTRMLPPLAVAVPISFMYSRLALFDTRFGLIILYTCFNLSFSTWMMKLFFDEIPTDYEEAAMLDGHSRPSAFFRIVLPQAVSGLLATSIFCLITSWNEYSFALTLTSTDAVTMPVRIHAIIGDVGVIPWGLLAAASLLFLAPILIFSLLMRKHLVQGISFGAVRE